MVANATAGGDLTGSGLGPRGFGFVLSGEAIGPSGRVVGCLGCLSEGVVGLAERGVGLSGDGVGLSSRAFGSVAGLSDCVVGLAERAVGLSGDVVGLSGRAFGSVVGLSGCVAGLAGRAVGLSGCSLALPFFSCSAAGELVSPARKANASAAASQCDFDFK